MRELRFKGEPIAQGREEALSIVCEGVWFWGDSNTIDGDEMWSFVPAPGPKRRRLQRAKVTQLVGASRREPHQVPWLLGAYWANWGSRLEHINKGALATSVGPRRRQGPRVLLDM